MAWRKSPPELVDAFDRALPADPRVERRKMFGYPCAFVGGNMFVGLHQESLIVRLPEDEREALIAAGRAESFEPMPGRRMREYVALGPAILGEDRRLAEMVGAAFAHTARLPPKAAKPRRKKG